MNIVDIINKKSRSKTLSRKDQRTVNTNFHSFTWAIHTGFWLIGNQAATMWQPKGQIQPGKKPFLWVWQITNLIIFLSGVIVTCHLWRLFEWQRTATAYSMIASKPLIWWMSVFTYWKQSHKLLSDYDKRLGKTMEAYIWK